MLGVKIIIREAKISIEKWHKLKLVQAKVRCFSMQVVMNKCFLLNLEKSLAQL